MAERGTAYAVGVARLKLASPAVSCEFANGGKLTVLLVLSPTVGVALLCTRVERLTFVLGVRLKSLKKAVSCVCCGTEDAPSPVCGVPSSMRIFLFVLSACGCNGLNCPVLNFSGDASARRLCRLPDRLGGATCC